MDDCKPKLVPCSWIKDKEVWYIKDGEDASLVLYPKKLRKGEKMVDKTRWVNLFHQTAGYACHHLYFQALFLDPKKEILPLMKILNEEWEESCISAPPCLQTAIKYEKVLSEYGLSANYSYSGLQEGFYPIDMECLSKVTTSVDPLKLEELIRRPRRKKPSMLDSLPHQWGLAILGQNCD